MGRIKRLGPYIFLFIIFILWILFILPMDLDGVWSYGFAHNIYNGLIPYKDFNMVITPLYPILMSLPFYLFKSSFFVISLSQVFLLLIIVYFLFKLLDQKAWLIILLFILFPHFFPNYNWLLFLEFLIVIYLEQQSDKDFYIGLVLSLTVLTKQSVGICLLLPSLLYIKDKTKILSRLKGFIIPIIVFIIYLITTNSLYNFYDLCIAGLFDFAGSNGKFLNINLLFVVLMMIITIYFIIKDNTDIKNYYVLAFLSIMLPLFDIYHFKYCWYVIAIMILLNIKIPNIPYKWISIFSITGITLFSLICIIQTQEIIYPNNINHFEYKRMTKNNLVITKKVNKFLKDNSDKEIILLNSNAYYFKIINDLKIGYLDLTNMGNWGYNGTKKMLKEIKSKKGSLFLINKNDLTGTYQTDRKVVNYVINNGKKIDKISIFDVYVLT